MKKTESTPYEQQISRLLSLRDGEPVAADQIDQSIADEDLLAELIALKAELNDLPDVAYDPSVWRDLPINSTRDPKVTFLSNHERQARTENTQARGQEKLSNWLRFPIATAASVFLVSALGIFLVFNQSGTWVGDDRESLAVNGTGDQVRLEPVMSDQGFQLAQLMTRSRDLEQVLQGDSPWALSSADSATIQAPLSGAPTPPEQLLLYRLADVDAQIARLYDGENIDLALRNQLWGQRVELLENLILVRGQDGAILSPPGSGGARSM